MENAKKSQKSQKKPFLAINALILTSQFAEPTAEPTKTSVCVPVMESAKNTEKENAMIFTSAVIVWEFWTEYAEKMASLTTTSATYSA